MATTSKQLNPKELLSLLQACRETGVRKLEWDGLKLEFDAPAPDPQTENQIAFDPDPSLSLKRHEELELSLREDQLQEMMAMDPEQYEELIAQRELVKKDTQHGDEADS